MICLKDIKAKPTDGCDNMTKHYYATTKQLLVRKANLEKNVFRQRQCQQAEY